jgi:AcrR family transcriptional regulator
MPDVPMEVKEPDTRARIVMTAERLFRTLGYKKTTVADIAEELGMSPANVYRFFPSKADIRDAVGRQLMGQVEAAVRTIADAKGPADVRLADAFRTINRLNTACYLSDKKMHEMVVVAMDENWGMVLEHLHVMDGLISEIIADGVKQGLFKVTDVLRAARCVKAAMISFCHPELLEQCADFPEPTLEHQFAFALAALKAGADGV